MDEKSLKKKLREARENLGYSQEAFAQELGVDPATYWRLEEGSTRVLNPYVYRIARLAGLSVEELLTGVEASSLLQESGNLRERIDALTAFYEKKLSEKDEIITNLNDYIKTIRK